MFRSLCPRSSSTIWCSPKEAEDICSLNQYVIQPPERFIEDVSSAHGVETLIHYPVPVHLQPAYVGRLGNPALLQTERVCREILSLPMHPYLERQDVCTISALITEFFEGA